MLNLQEPYIYHNLFENSAREGGFLESPFMTFQSRFPKRMWFLSRFTLNLLKNHIPFESFENSAHEGGFLKSLSQITIFKSDFSEPISKKKVVFE